MVWKEHSETWNRASEVYNDWRDCNRLESDVRDLGDVEVAAELPLLEGVSQLRPLADGVVSVAQPHVQGHHRSFLCKSFQHR